jgi:hypothetical protein
MSASESTVQSIRVDVVGLQGRVDVADVVLSDQRQRDRRGQPGGAQRGLIDPAGGDDPDPGDGAHVRTVCQPPVARSPVHLVYLVHLRAARHDDGHRQAVHGDQLVDQPVRQRVVAAHDIARQVVTVAAQGVTHPVA